MIRATDDKVILLSSQIRVLAKILKMSVQNCIHRISAHPDPLIFSKSFYQSNSHLSYVLEDGLLEKHMVIISNK